MGTPHLSSLSSPFSYYSSTINPKTPFLTHNNLPPQSHYSPFANSDSATISHAFRGSRFEFENEIRRENRRNWWSDEDDDDDDEDDDDDDEEFGFWDESSSFDWILKAFQAFGWMVPAVIISSLLGTGTNSLIMALVLPLGQTALSLVLDKLWEGPSSSPNPGPRSRSRPRPRPKTRNSTRAGKKPFAGTTYGNQRKAQEAGTRIPNGRGGYQSWGAANNSSAMKGGENGSRFGGWDELDKQVESNRLSEEALSVKIDGIPRQQIWAGKLNRRRNREQPLFMRLLIAVFPMLGSWTRFLF